jgi:hypothetical protein
MTEPPEGGGTPPPPPYPYSTPGQPETPPLPAADADSAAQPVRPRNGLGVGSLVVAIIALLTVWSVVLGVIAGLVAVIMGFVARGRVKRGTASNGGVAVAGIVLGFIAIIASVAFVFIWAWVFRDYVDCVRAAGNDTAKVQKCTDDFRQHFKERYNIKMR